MKSKSSFVVSYYVIFYCLLLLVKSHASANYDLLVAMTDHYPPFEYIEDGSPRGISIEILNLILKKLDIEVSIRFMPWSRAYKIATTTPNTMLMTMSKTEERDQYFEWVGPIYKTQVKVYRLQSRKNINLVDIDAAKNYRVGTVRGYASEKLLLSNGFSFGDNLFSASDSDINFQKLLGKRIDLLVSNDLTIVYLLKKYLIIIMPKLYLVAYLVAEVFSALQML
ncbi:substrate-binding periplasmic protein, partial [Spartinivicinus poritis]